jgi:hypothetical protein
MLNILCLFYFSVDMQYVDYTIYGVSPAWGGES